MATRRSGDHHDICWKCVNVGFEGPIGWKMGKRPEGFFKNVCRTEGSLREGRGGELSSASCELVQSWKMFGGGSVWKWSLLRKTKERDHSSQIAHQLGDGNCSELRFLSLDWVRQLYSSELAWLLLSRCNRCAGMQNVPCCRPLESSSNVQF